ncbi:endonuclease/exonuclease/phosphatase family protein [Caulobacter soli]|uniref:endonuclease/exonuclease/phosphatase family protein n=1 Tax=Caulobacter soli TaxID=2708539 RepID=UPI0013EB1064|nr:endonuclease/exonuclease/phosphatase family protein [Caulobacter soli]
MRLILNLASLFLRGTALMFGLVGGLAGLACWGGMFSGKLDALTHLAPIWLACGVAGLVLGAVFTHEAERKAIIGLSATAIIAIGLLMAPELLSAARSPAKTPEARPLKLIQFNVWAENHDPQETLNWIRAQNADVVMLEEAGGQSWSIVMALRKVYPYAVSCDGDRYCDTWIFSRLPIVARRGFYQDGRGLPGAWATLRRPDGDFTVAATHYTWPLPAGSQLAQSRRLISLLKPFPRDSLIVTGDFNSTPWSWSLRRQDKALGLERRTRALASWPTGRFSRVTGSPFPILPIDHVYAGKAWKTVKVERGPSLGSDHRPVVVTLAR